MKNSLLSKLLSTELDPAFSRRAEILLGNLEAKKNDRILEVGCGRGFYAKAVSVLFPKTTYIGIDVNEIYLKKARDTVRNNKTEFIKEDATFLSFSNNYFDVIICTEVLEHIGNDKKALSEIYRVLKPGGKVIITVPCRDYPFFWDPINWLLEKTLNKHIPSDIWWLAGIWADHVRLYKEKSLIDMLKKENFRIKKVWRSTFYCLPFCHFFLYGIGKNLVERKLLPSEFNRFIFTSEPSPLLKLVKSIINFVDRLNDNKTSGSRYVNIILKASKN